ncbi:Excinuclease ABC subunit C [Actinopolyspora mzabensis]|uniref:UvrABC system protein C n=1 Tax=Actinopolyspora mzabensis TaxID=995066 RepID=A0A1G8ZNN7_ACTMZ|nr:excinuclease ABC subunit UvrC [Actinopolyspora mzabensis]SDK16194.1 Excinuclease ABC subunit C [Actinopolyspora mzabensis]
MADPSTYRPAPGTIPDSPGVYRFHDGEGRVIYVGKAKSLRSRLSNYFADLSALHPRTRQMVTTATGVHWTVVNTEVEALQLEYSWIKEFDPRFNVRYRDDKSYPVLAVTLHEEFPRLHVYRGPRRKGVRYFGPYAHAWAIRDTLDTLLRVFPARTCSNNVFKRHAQMGRPCLLGYIDKCSAPCVGRVEADEHRRIVDEFCDFLSGRTDAITRRLRERMEQASEQLDFERAARLRDDLEALRRAMEKQAVVLGDGTDADVAAFAEDELAAAVQVFHVRGGRVRGQRGWVIDKVERTETAELVEHFLTQFYGEQAALADQADAGGTPVPREVLVPELPEDSEAVAQWLGRLRGSKVGLRVPQRGDKRTLLETVRANAQEAFKQYKLRRAGDINARSAALQELQDSLGLDSAPLRIECVDVSHVQGTDVVASLVVFEDGVARKSEYRRFSVRGGGEGGDTAAMAEVVRRRFNRYLRETGTEQGPGAAAEAVDAGPVVDAGSLPGTGSIETSDGAQAGHGTGESESTGESEELDSTGNEQPPGVDPDTGKPRKFAYPPNLLVVDGGAPQANAAADELAELGITDVAVIGLAKRLEEVWLPAEPEPLVLSRTSEALYLLQRVRDEAHRFAIAYHRKQRSKRMTDSELDAVPGLGQVKKKALLKHFGSLRKIRAATIEEISAVPGFGRRTAEAVHGALSGAAETGAASDAAASDAAESDTAEADVAESDAAGAETAEDEATGTAFAGRVAESSGADDSQGRNISSTVTEPTGGVRDSETGTARDGDGTAGG